MEGNKVAKVCRCPHSAVTAHVGPSADMFVCKMFIQHLRLLAQGLFVFVRDRSS
jgi:hypothetical protein